MQITLYSGFSKEVNSTKQPSGGTNVNCYLKDDTSLVKPVFILESANFSVNYVKWNNRFYFVDDIVSIRNGAVEVHCSIDALASWKTQIGASSQYVTRSASSYNDYIIDNMYPATVQTIIESVDFAGMFDTDVSYVVGIISSDGITYHLFTEALLRSVLFDFLYGNPTWLDAPLTELSRELQKELVNPFQYIASIYCFPFRINAGSTGSLKFGYWEKAGQLSTVLSASERYNTRISGISVPRHPQTGIRGNYMNSSPFTRMTLLVPCFGTIPLDPQNYITSDRLQLELKTDLFTGVGELRISNSGDPNTLISLSAQIGVPLQISQITQNLINTAVSAVGVVGSIATGNALGALMGAKSAIENLMPQLQTTGSMGSMVNFTHQPKLTMQYKNLVPIDTDHIGRPLMQRVTLSSLSGYILVENPDVDIPATTEEKNAIISYMQNGFYYE